MEEAEAAILVRGACKQYGNKDSRMVLDNLDMTVIKGTIYGLLGASGCGKTTLLSAVVGVRKIQNGQISVLGKPPGIASVKSVGYMPQDIALVGEFTVKGALQHYGWIFGMTDEQINKRHAFLEKLLDLPSPNKMIKNLSGGQQRRVSLAAVLVHDPELLILDEPTVGLDPVLRQNIWDYLVKITKEEKKTIIITTHYIEEAKQAHTIGLMRNGKILAEGEPRTLLNIYNCSTIEDMFVFLCKKQKDGSLSTISQQNTYKCIYNVDELEILGHKPPKRSVWDRIYFTNKGHAKALMTKNVIRFKRHPGSLIFSFFFPVLQISVFFLVVGVIPSDMKIGIVNEELGNYTDCSQYATHDGRIGGQLLDDNTTCIYYGLGCRFVQELSDKLPNKIYFKTKEEALEEARKGNVHQVLYFSQNYSESVTLVRDRTKEITDEDLEWQEISVYRDVIDHALSNIVEKELYNTFRKFLQGLATDCHTNPHIEKFPIVFNDPVYGDYDLTYTEFIAPGMMAIITVFMSLGVSALTITTERTEGIWERTIVAGVTTTEILIFHTITLCAVAVIQISELFVLAFYVFNLICKGQKLIVFLLVYMQAIIGICFGILISVVTKNVTEANYASLGAFYPFITLTGCFWPLEGMPTALRYISYLVPPTFSVESLSNIIHRGWGISNFHVFKAFLSSTGFICFFTILSILTLKFEKK